MIDPYVKVIILLSGMVLFVQIDSAHLKRNQYIYDHIPRYILRGLFVFALGALNWKHTTGLSMLFIATFDNTLNYVMRWGWLHLGTTATWDKFWINKMFLYKTVIFICLLGGLTLMII